MIEAIIMDKLIGVAHWFNMLGWGICVVIFVWTFIRGLRDTGYYQDEEWSIDYYNIAQREDKFTNLTIIFCIIQTIILFNPLTLSEFVHTQPLYYAFEGMYGYLVMFSINHEPFRIFSIPMLSMLLLLYRVILSNNKGKGTCYDYKEQITRSKFINTTMIIIVALFIQVAAYLLVPSNDFIIHHIAGMDLEL